MESGIFISYRRDDTRQAAGRLANDLEDVFGAERIFRDIEKIELGVDFDEALTIALKNCEVMLVLIGHGWSGMQNEHGQRRLDMPADWIRTEIATALQRGIRVVPVLVDGAPLPTEAELPEDIRPLIRKQAFKIQDEGWRSSVATLADGLSRLLAPLGTASAAAVPAAAPAPGPVPKLAPGGGSKKLIYAGAAAAAVVVLAVVFGGGGNSAIPETASLPKSEMHSANMSGAWYSPDQRKSLNITQNGADVAVTLWHWDEKKGDWSEAATADTQVDGANFSVKMDFNSKAKKIPADAPNCQFGMLASGDMQSECGAGPVDWTRTVPSSGSGSAKS